MHNTTNNYDAHAVEQTAAQTWENDPITRVEFGGNREAWMAFCHADAKGLNKGFPEFGVRTAAAGTSNARAGQIQAAPQPTLAQHAQRMWNAIPELKVKYGTWQKFAAAAGVQV